MSKIEWTDQTWNPVTGCTKISPGCANCYAEVIAKRFWGERKFTDVQTFPARLRAPLSWRKPRMVFVNSMSDLFHEDIELDYIAAVFGVMAATPEHTYQVLTKRPERMNFFIEWMDEMARIAKDTFPDDSKEWRRAQCLKGFALKYGTDVGNPTAIAERPWPLPNVWLGVSVEDQKTADERIPLLLQTPSACAFVSYEPALEAVSLSEWLPLLNWVIVGGESGSGARRCDVNWIRAAVVQCKAAGVPVFVKQLGGWWARQQPDWYKANCPDRKGGHQDRWPDFLRVRQFPEVAHA